MKIRDFIPVPSIPLQSAVLCESCHQITASRHSTCDLCGSEALMSLPNLLSYKISPQDAAFFKEVGVVIEKR